MQSGSFGIAGKRARSPLELSNLDHGQMSIAPTLSQEEVKLEVVKDVARSFVDSVVKAAISKIGH